MESDNDIQKSLESVVLFKIDAEKGEGPELAKEYRVQGYPTFVFANAGGDVMDTWSGYAKAHFMSHLETAASDPTTFDQKKSRFDSAPTVKDANALARYYGTRGDYAAAVTVSRKAAELEPSGAAQFKVFENTMSAARRGADGFDFAAVEAEAKKVLEHDNDASTLVRLAGMMDMMGRSAQKREAVVPFLAPALEASAGSNDEATKAQRTSLEIAHALLVEKDAEKAVTMKRASMSEGWMDSAGGLNGFAWWCFENNVNLAEAEELARRGIELAPAGKERAMILDTAAEICNARGNCDDAVELIERALSEDPTNEFYQEQLKRFQDIRAEQAN